ncbi:MAG: hypothetical protein RIS70_509 [Planctomycetota bacterium]
MNGNICRFSPFAAITVSCVLLASLPAHAESPRSKRLLSRPTTANTTTANSKGGKPVASPNPQKPPAGSSSEFSSSQADGSDHIGSDRIGSDRVGFDSEPTSPTRSTPAHDLSTADPAVIAEILSIRKHLRRSLPGEKFLTDDSDEEFSATLQELIGNRPAAQGLSEPKHDSATNPERSPEPKFALDANREIMEEAGDAPLPPSLPIASPPVLSAPAAPRVTLPPAEGFPAPDAPPPYLPQPLEWIPLPGSPAPTTRAPVPALPSIPASPYAAMPRGSYSHPLAPPFVATVNTRSDVVRSLRQMGRQFDQLAADMEDQHFFDDAESLRGLAQSVRDEARRLETGLTTDEPAVSLNERNTPSPEAVMSQPGVTPIRSAVTRPAASVTPAVALPPIPPDPPLIVTPAVVPIRKTIDR